MTTLKLRRALWPTTAILLAAGLLATSALPALAEATKVLVAGDIGQAGGRMADTANIIKWRKGIVLTAGDHAYVDGTYAEFMDYYDPTWGAFLGRTRSTSGNHDWHVPGAPGYFTYFGGRAGPPGRGYYSFKAGSWRVFSLDTEVCEETGCGPGTAQYKWLKSKLQKSRERCTLAVYHVPLHSSGAHGDSADVRPLQQLLYNYGADAVVNAHAHSYERFAPARPSGKIDYKHGLRQFVVGTGGAALRGIGAEKAPHSRVFESETFGVLKLTLRKNSYDWKFLPISGQDFADSGTGYCHGKP